MTYKEIMLAALFISPITSANTQVVIDKDEIFYVGGLTSEANAKVFDLYEKSTNKPGTLNITSTGGDIQVGMELGEWLVEKKLHVKVEDYCMSSCANYIFPAGVNKYIGSKALVAFHGGAHSESFISNDESTLAPFPEDKRESVKKAMDEALRIHRDKTGKRETEFYKKIGVSKSINTLGQLGKYSNHGTHYNGWYYSLEDLEKFGVNNLIVIDGPWNPQSHAITFNVFKLSLPDGEFPGKD